MSQIQFGEHRRQAGFRPYDVDPFLFAYDWKHQIVGHTAQGLLYVERKTGHEYHVALAPWNTVTDLSFGTCVSLQGLFLSSFAIGVAVVVFFAGWVYKNTTGVGIYTIPVACGAWGIYLLCNVHRHFVRAMRGKLRVKWMSPPGKFLDSLSIHEQLEAYCRQHNVSHRASVDSWRPVW
jgi:hypothetical protein